MKNITVKRVLCIALAIAATVTSTGCGSNNSKANEERTAVSVESEVSLQEETESSASEASQASAPQSVTTTKVKIAKTSSDSISDKFPDAYHFVKLTEDRYLVMTCDTSKDETIATIYDSKKDEIVVSVFVNTHDEIYVNPVVFDGKGFGFTYEITRNSGRTHMGYGSYYDVDGNLVNEFKIDMGPDWNGELALAPDGSTMYAVLTDRVQCACGYDFKADYVTRVIAVYGDGSEKQLAEFDSHTNVYLYGALDFGKLLVYYDYDPNDKEILSHEEYEKQFMPVDPNTPDIERGLAYIDANDGSFEKVYDLDRYYSGAYMSGSSLVVTNSGFLTYLHFDEDGTVTKEETGYSTTNSSDNSGKRASECLLSADGKYVVYVEYSGEPWNGEDTTIKVYHYEDDKLEAVFEETYDDWYVDVDVFDDKTGDIHGKYSESKDGGLTNQGFCVNIN